LQYLLALTKKSICSFLSSSFNHVLLFTLKGTFRFLDNVFIILIVDLLFFNNADHHPDFITLFAGQPVFSSIQNKLFQYIFSISKAVCKSFSLFHPKICKIKGFSNSVCIICFITLSGFAI
jgi:hypothetical protein